MKSAPSSSSATTTGGSSVSQPPRLPRTPQSRSLAVAALRFVAILAWSYLESAFRFVQRCLGLAPAQISGKIVLVTGAAQGIGLATARLFARHKCVTVLTDVNTSVHDAAKSLTAEGHLTASYQLDVTNPAAVSECFDDVVKRFGRIDVLVSNAGILHGKSLLDLTEAQIRATVDVNLLGTVWVTRAVLRHMIKQRRGHIISIASMAACMGVAYCTDYSASKFGVVGFMEAVEDELRRMGLYRNGAIRLTTVCPTFLDPKAGGVLVGKSVRPGYGPSKLLVPDTVAHKIVEAVKFKRRFLCVPEKLGFNFFARGFLPWRAARAFQDLDGSYFDEM